MARALWTDHRPRIEFYVREGLVEKTPTDEQLARAFGKIRNRVPPAGLIRYYWRHPLMILPTARKQASARHNIANGYVVPHQAAAEGLAPRSERPLLDRFLERTFLFAPARLAVQSIFDPWALVPSSGLNVPRRFLIAHILHTNHPPPAMWDMQIVQADEGGLDALRRELERAMRSPKLRARIDRSLGCREGYYEYLLDWIPRVGRFEFPPVPPALDPIGESVVEYLRYALEL